MHVAHHTLADKVTTEGKVLDDIAAGLFGWAPKRLLDALGRILKRIAVLPTVLGTWVLAVVAMVATWPRINQGIGWALAVWFVAPILAIMITAAFFARRAPGTEPEPPVA
jgi:hypothetical protein